MKGSLFRPCKWKHSCSLMACFFAGMLVMSFINLKNIRTLVSSKFSMSESPVMALISTKPSNKEPNIFGLISSQYESTFPPRPIIVIIQAYMHTGSSYTGSVIQQHAGTFYENEPLRSLETDYKRGKTVRFLNGTDRLLPDYKSYVDVGGEAVQNMITCHHDRLDMATLGNYYFETSSSIMRDTASFFRCQRRQPKSELPVSIERIQNCLPLIIDKCKNAQIRLTKFIRMAMNMTERILNQFDNVKIIHLIRDPRAMLDSQVRKNDNNSKDPKSFRYNTEQMCLRMQRDIKLATTLKGKYPDKIKTYRYEDLVDDPLGIAKSMFDFIKVPFLATDSNFVRKSSIDSVKNYTVMSVIWRSHISQNNLQTIDAYCQSVYKSMGYIRYKSVEDIQTLSKPTYIKDIFHENDV